MSLRCAVCGSKRITVETKKEGYDVVKGVVGTALVGIPGALAGAGGKENTYYHCADCGQVLNKPMLSVESDWIDMLLENPANWKNQLKEKKARYKNIEWEDADFYAKPLRELTEEEKIEQMEDEILCYLNQVGTLVEEKKIKKRLGLSSEDWSWDLDKALDSLYDSGRIDREYVDSERCFSIVRDIKEVETKRLQNQAIDKVFELESENKDKWVNCIWNSLEVNKTYTWNELEELGKTSLENVIVSDNPWLIVMIARHTLASMTNKGMLTKENEVYRACSEEEIKKSIQEKEQQEKERERVRKQVEDEIKGKILNYLRSNYGKYTITYMHDNASELSEFSVAKLTSMLLEMVEEGTVERIEERKIRYYAVAGYTEKLKEEERRKEEKRRAEERRRQEEERRRKEERKAVLTKEIEDLRKQKAGQESIFNANQGKWFGEGAKAKKAAKKEIENLNNRITQLYNEIASIR